MEKKRRRGRPTTVMTPEAQDKILAAVRLGLWPDRACAVHGISDKTMRSHLSHHPDFQARLDQAIAEAERVFWARMMMHAQKSYQACAWLMEKRWPDRYGKKPEQDVAVTLDAKVESAAQPPTQNQALAEYALAFAAAAASIQKLHESD